MARILVVEDDAGLRAEYKFVLEHAGYTVDVAEDGRKALELTSSMPDVILLDMMMPGLSGLEFLKQAKLSEKQPACIIVALSNFDDHKIVQEAMKLGATKYLLKVNETPASVVHQVNSLVTLLAKPKE